MSYNNGFWESVINGTIKIDQLTESNFHIFNQQSDLILPNHDLDYIACTAGSFTSELSQLLQLIHFD